MKKKNKKLKLSILFMALMLASIVPLGTNNVSASTVPEDGYEENDDFWSASEISPGLYPNLCQGDEDWFNVSIGVDEVIKVSITFDGDQNNIQLELYDNMQNMRDFSWTLENYEYVAWISDVPQSVYIKIRGDNNEEAYDMNVEIFAKGAYDDDYEENDDFPSASEIYPNFFNSLVNNDPDYYKIYIDSDFSINIYNTSILSAQLYSNYYGLITDFSIEGSYLKLDWIPSYTGDYYIVVFGTDLGDLYDMDIWMTDDWAEPNDFLSDATNLGFGYHSGLIQKDIDWYEVWIEPYNKFEIKLFYDTGYTEMYLEIYDEYEGLLTDGYNEGDHKYLSWTNNDDYGRNFYIKITGNDIRYWYNIELNLIGDDDFEDNDDWYSASYIDSGEHNPLYNLDDDYYKFRVDRGETGIILIQCDSQASLYLEEINSGDGSTLNSDYSTDDGLLELHIYVDFDDYVGFAVKGNNLGEEYSIEIIIEGDQNGNDNNDPFANLEIPGFPMVGTVFVISTFAVIFFVNKKKL